MLKPVRWFSLVVLGMVVVGMTVLSVGCAATPSEPALPDEPAPDDTGAAGLGSDEEQLDCTKIGCNSGFRVALQRKFWPPGRYVFTVETDGERTVCEGGLPLNRCELGGNLKCDSGDNPNPRGVQIAESGCDLPAEQQRWGDIQIEGTPKHVQISIELGGSSFGGTFFDPKYETLTPNGVKCGPVCEVAAGSMQLECDPRYKGPGCD